MHLKTFIKGIHFLAIRKKIKLTTWPLKPRFNNNIKQIVIIFTIFLSKILVYYVINNLKPDLNK